MWRVSQDVTVTVTVTVTVKNGHRRRSGLQRYIRQISDQCSSGYRDRMRPVLRRVSGLSGTVTDGCWLDTDAPARLITTVTDSTRARPRTRPGPAGVEPGRTREIRQRHCPIWILVRL
jgi:hypothetical protein